MKIIIASHDVIPEKCHLMPWRTLCEVTTHLRNQGHDVTLISLSEGKQEVLDFRLPYRTRNIRKATTHLYNDLLQLVSELQPDIIFWPISWRESLIRTHIVSSLKIPLIGYFPGGYYSLKTCLYAVKQMGFKITLPYLIEAVVPHFLQLLYLKVKGFKRIVTMTDLTARHVIGFSWKEHEVVYIPAGKELEDDLLNVQALPVDFEVWINQRTFYLFMGPPSSIRGIYELLKGFELAAQNNKDICLVCLFRSDAKLDAEAIANFIDEMKHKDRIYCQWESVPKEILNAFISQCHAVVMPFILVPSEIPLAIIETLQWGKPVISTKQGGTGDFVAQFGLSPEVGDIKGLAKAILDLYQDKALYKKKCLNVQSVYKQHPNWHDMAQSWLEVANSVVKEF